MFSLSSALLQSTQEEVSGFAEMNSEDYEKFVYQLSMMSDLAQNVDDQGKYMSIIEKLQLS